MNGKMTNKLRVPRVMTKLGSERQVAASNSVRSNEGLKGPELRKTCLKLGCYNKQENYSNAEHTYIVTRLLTLHNYFSEAKQRGSMFCNISNTVWLVATFIPNISTFCKNTANFFTVNER